MFLAEEPEAQPDSSGLLDIFRTAQVSDAEFRVLVCGGRDFMNSPLLYVTMDDLHTERRISKIIHGKARGADMLAEAWAISRGIDFEGFPAYWERFGDRAGPIRNRRMLNIGKPHVVVAFHGKAGTRDMCRIAAARGVPVRKIGWN